MSTSSDLRQRLRQQTGRAMARHAAGETEVRDRARRSAGAGRSFPARRDRRAGDRVGGNRPGCHRSSAPADRAGRYQPLDRQRRRGRARAPDGDARPPAARGPLTLRGAFGVWLDAERLDPELRSGVLEPEHLARARQKNQLLAEGARVGSVLERRVDVDPEYQDWVAGLLEAAREALSEPRARPRDAISRSGSSPDRSITSKASSMTASRPGEPGLADRG